MEGPISLSSRIPLGENIFPEGDLNGHVGSAYEDTRACMGDMS